MPEVVKVSTVEKTQSLMSTIEEYFKKGRYAEINQAIGLHSLLIDPQHTLSDQARLYRFVLTMIKNRIAGTLGKKYAAWYADFPKIMDKIISSGQIVTDEMSASVVADHHNAYGSFRSLEDFYFWALDDRRLTLDQIVKYIEKTADIGTC